MGDKVSDVSYPIGRPTTYPSHQHYISMSANGCWCSVAGRPQPLACDLYSVSRSGLSVPRSSARNTRTLAGTESLAHPQRGLPGGLRIRALDLAAAAVALLFDRS